MIFKSMAEANNSTLRMSDEMYLLTLVSVNTHLYPELRAVIDISKIKDPAAKELFIALEECFRDGKSGMDALLSRIATPALRNFIIEMGKLPEFKRDPRKIMADGIKRITVRRFLLRESMKAGDK